MSNNAKNFVLFCWATLVSAAIFMLASMIIDQATTPVGQRTPEFGMTQSTTAMVVLSAFELIAICALAIAFRSRLKPVQ